MIIWIVQSVQTRGNVSSLGSATTLFVRSAFQDYMNAQCVPRLKEATVLLDNEG
jgi:hypothetical protein